jgi:hypothetical protein
MTTPCGSSSMRHWPLFASFVRCTAWLYFPSAGAYACCESTVATRSPVSVYVKVPVSSRPTGGRTASVLGPSASTVVDCSGCQPRAALADRYRRAVL